jgi:general stress protein YciG
MKRLIAAAVILVLLSVLTFWGGRFVSKTEKEVIEKSSSIIKEPTDEKIKEFKDYWQKRGVMLSFFANRESIEDIGKAASKMIAASENNDREEILESAEEIKYIIGHIAEQENFSLQSFF